jgi:hypothetical protein
MRNVRQLNLSQALRPYAITRLSLNDFGRGSKHRFAIEVVAIVPASVQNNLISKRRCTTTPFSWYTLPRLD